MELTAARRGDGIDMMHTKIGAINAGGLPILMLDAFEAELDSLLSLVEEQRNPGVTEAIIRRYATAEELHNDLIEQMQRLGLKMQMAGTQITDSLGAGVLNGK